MTTVHTLFNRNQQFIHYLIEITLDVYLIEITLDVYLCLNDN